MNIRKWRKVIGKYFPELVLPAEVGLSVIAQLCLKDIKNPFGLVYVDVPSSGKTITLNFFSCLKDIVYATDFFTPSSFVTHAGNRKKEELKLIDLLPKIKHKLFLVRDLAPIFGMRDDDLLKTMGILTRIFDGEGLLTESGLYGQRGYRGDYLFMFLAASTPIRPRVWKVMGNFGSRLFFLNMNIPDKDCETLINQLNPELSLKMKQKRCRKATRQLIKQVFEGVRSIAWDSKGEDKELYREIVTISQMVACLRGTANVWADRSNDETFNFAESQIEKPDRIIQAFYNLARGHAIVCGRRRITDQDIAIVIKIALSSAPLERVKFFNLLIKKNGEISTEGVMHGLVCSRKTALKYMTTFTQLTITEEGRSLDMDTGRPEKTTTIAKKFTWFTESRFKELNKLT